MDLHTEVNAFRSSRESHYTVVAVVYQFVILLFYETGRHTLERRVIKMIYESRIKNVII